MSKKTPSPEKVIVQAPQDLNFAMLNQPVRFKYIRVEKDKRDYVQISAGIVCVDIPVSKKRLEQIYEWVGVVKDYIDG